jgi:copper oxidase (laccase) domain-containing protein
VEVGLDRERAIENLAEHHLAGVVDLGFRPEDVAVGEQVHGGKIAQIVVPRGLGDPISGVDGLITAEAGVLLAIYVADCCAVFIADRRGRAVALVHSGKKGTELGIAPAAIAKFGALGIEPADLVVQLSPCIRPPLYEVDIAAMIRRDCLDAGVPQDQLHDVGACTGADTERYYSYRVEKGLTGRMLALIGIAPVVECSD